MKISRFLAYATLAGSLMLGTAAMAADPHAHAAGHDGHGEAGLTLDHGKMWQTDAPLRAGMTEIRTAVATSLDPIHAGKFNPSDFDALAGRIEGQIDMITKSCHLPEQADAQLHIVLAQIIDGIGGMRGQSGARIDGAVAVIKALDAYGRHFTHKGWQPITH
ncbi:conserved exported hypothetical protein [Candidatus Terasakiella magnetica]|nr:conserved exported hypothetical protein [Candidatus Terasakiella magnetica]